MPTAPSRRPAATTWIRRIAQRLGNVVLPPLCPGCDAPICSSLDFCFQCGNWNRSGYVTELFPPSLPRPLRIYTVGEYRPPLSTAIARFKFNGRSDLAQPLARLLLTQNPFLSNESESQPLLVPVPLHYARLVQRGFNPAALLARQWARPPLGSYARKALIRLRDTPQQSRSGSRAERFDNVQGAFRASSTVQGQSVILVDDVHTTGATAISCAEALYASGARNVHVLTLAIASTQPPARLPR